MGKGVPTGMEGLWSVDLRGIIGPEGPGLTFAGQTSTASPRIRVLPGDQGGLYQCNPHGGRFPPGCGRIPIGLTHNNPPPFTKRSTQTPPGFSKVPIRHHERQGGPGRPWRTDMRAPLAAMASPPHDAPQPRDTGSKEKERGGFGDEVPADLPVWELGRVDI